MTENLTARRYPQATLAGLYVPLTMPPDLGKAHQSLDRAVAQPTAARPLPPCRKVNLRV